MVIENICNHTQTKKGGVASIPDTHPLYSVSQCHHLGMYNPK